MYNISQFEITDLLNYWLTELSHVVRLYMYTDDFESLPILLMTQVFMFFISTHVVLRTVIHYN